MGEMARLRALSDEALAYDLGIWHRAGLWCLLLACDARVRRAARLELSRRRRRPLSGPTSDLTGTPVEWTGTHWQERPRR